MLKITIKDYSGNFSSYMVKDKDTVFSLKIQISRINAFLIMRIYLLIEDI